MDLKSILGYSSNSPFKNNPYIDINSNIIDMSDTPIDLWGIDTKTGKKKRMKAGRKTPYIFEGNVREIPMQAGGPVYTSYKKIKNDNDYVRDLLTRQHANPYLASNAVVARDIGDPIPQFVNPSGNVPINQRKLATTLPSGVSANDVFPTSEGVYGYYHPQNGTFVPVDPNSIYNMYGNKDVATRLKSGGLSSSKAKEMLRDGTAHGEPLTKRQKRYFGWVAGGKKQTGGYTDFVKEFLYDDDEEYDQNTTAPSADEIGVEEEGQQQESQQPADADVQYNLALQIAMEGLMRRRGDTNPYRDVGVGQTSQPQATPQMQQFAPSSSESYSNTTSGQNVPKNQRPEYAFNYYKQKGLAPHVAAGIVGNLMQESGHFRDDVIKGQYAGDNGTSFGIAQWHKDRWPKYLNWAKSQGRNPYVLDSQLEYVYVEANQRGDLQKTNRTKTSKEAANVFAKWFEVPAIIDRNRGENAYKLHPYQKGGVYTIPYEQLLEIKKKGYKYKLI